MSKEIAAALAAPFEAKDLKQRPGRGGLTFTYADARAVAQRLDDTLGIEGWQFEVKVADPARSVVHGSLCLVIDGKTTIKQDFGYPNGPQDDEPLKSAASDALRRCAAQVGVGRSLYSPEKAQGGIKTLPQPQTLASVAQKGKSGGFSEAPADLSDDAKLALKAAMIFAESATEGACSHGQAWSLKPGGVSKATGKPYNPFWAASHKAPDGSWCKDKPSAKWVAAHSKPEAPAMVPQENFEDLPF
ncbi:MAG: Rad52/Rad22 family DNA repair protein [Hylemonella sp.]